MGNGTRKWFRDDKEKVNRKIWLSTLRERQK